MTPIPIRHCAIATLLLMAFVAAIPATAEEPITPIGMLLVNPSAFHRKLFKVEGVVNEVRPYSKYEVTSVCGASFKLTDDTGMIEYRFANSVRGEEQATFVNEGSRITEEGSMEAPSAVLRNLDGKDHEFAIYARSVVPARKQSATLARYQYSR